MTVFSVAGAVLLACSSSGSSTGVGPTPVTALDMPTCTPLAQGCFVTAGGAMPAPSATEAACPSPGSVARGPADDHCRGKAQAVSGPACAITKVPGGKPAAARTSARPGPCGENSAMYGQTLFGSEGDDDDCKYHVSFESTPVCQNDGVYFTVKAKYLTRGGAPVTGACTMAELCLSDTHPAPLVDALPPTGQQHVVEGPPGTYTIGPVEFDAPGTWTVRFHFDEACCDASPESPHAHAAFHVKVP